MKKLVIASFIAIATSASAQSGLGDLLKLQAGVALGKQVLDATKSTANQQQAAEQRPNQPVRTNPAPGSIEAACVNALSQEETFSIRAIDKDAEIKRNEARLEIYKSVEKLSATKDGMVRDLPKMINADIAAHEKLLGELSRAKLTRERICAGLIN